MPEGKPLIRDCVSRFGKLTVVLFCQALILCLLAFLEVQVLIAHYQTTESALRLLGFESRPLEGDKLLGPYFGAVFGEATVSQMLAWVIVLVVAMGSCYVLAKIALLKTGMIWPSMTACTTLAGDPAGEISPEIQTFVSTTTRTLTPDLSHFYGYFSGRQWSEFLRCSSYGPYLLRKALPRRESTRRLNKQCVTFFRMLHRDPVRPLRIV